MRRLSFLLACSLAGCVPAVSPSVPVLGGVSVPTALTKANAAVQPQENVALPDKWWESFHNPALDRLVAQALAHNPGLDEARNRLLEAQALVFKSKSLLYPHVNSGGAIIHTRISRNGPTEPYSGVTANLATLFPLMVNYDLDLWGRDDALIQASEASEEITRARYRESALMLSSAVIKTYFALHSAKELVERQTRIVQLSEERMKLLDTSFQTGIGPRPPVLTSQTQWHEARNELEKLQRQLSSLNYALYELIGKSPEDTLTPTVPSRPDQFPLPARVDLNLVSQRPDVQAALWNIRRNQHLEKAARAAFYPNINLVGLMGFNSIGISDLVTPAGGIYAYGPAFDLPIFEGGALEGQLHATEAARNSAIDAYNHALLVAVREIADGLSTMKHRRERLEEISAAVTARTAETEIDQEKFGAGISGKLPYLDALIRLESEQMKKTEESLDWLNSITDTATALGGGFGGWAS